MPATTTSPPAAAQITDLQHVREYPATSVLLTTTPAAQLTHADAQRLDALAAQAVDRVRAELQPDAAAPAVRRLQALLEQAHHGPATHALALYACASTESLIRLPVAVRDRPARGSDTDNLDFYRNVDAALGTYLRLHPAPLILDRTRPHPRRLDRLHHTRRPRPPPRRRPRHPPVNPQPTTPSATQLS